MSAFEKLQALNIELCRASGAGKGAETTVAAAKAYHQIMWERRSEVAAAIASAWAEYRTAGASPNRAHRHFIEGMEAMLKYVVHPSATPYRVSEVQQ